MTSSLTHTGSKASDGIKRPHTLTECLPILERLALYGGAHPQDSLVEWLIYAGVIWPQVKNADWAVPVWDWLMHALPANSAQDLARKTALRDPLYRRYLDIGIASVLHAVAASRRWDRFEELLFGPYASFAPRFLQLIHWAANHANMPPENIDPEIWSDLASDSDTFAIWDHYLWGTSGKPEVLFPILGDLYIPLLDTPVSIDSARMNLPASAGALLVRLLNKDASSEEPLHIDASSAAADIVPLLKAGVPLKVALSRSGTVEVATVGRYYIVQDQIGSKPSSGVAHSKNGYMKQDPPAEVSDALWDMVDFSRSAVAFFGVAPHSEIWPEDLPGPVPPWARLPGRNVWADIAKARHSTPEVESALARLCSHPFWGLMMQVFLLEALDRELGDESLILSPPLHRRVDDIEVATRVYYRPESKSENSEAQSKTFLDLGLIDPVLNEISRSVGLQAIHFPYGLGRFGPWSKALQLLRSIDIVTGGQDRWLLSTPVLDRLHGGGLMTAVIRRGNRLREQLHGAFRQLWEAADRESIKGYTLK